MLTKLEGQIERVTYTNEENGFTIAKLRVRGHGDLVTVVGNLLLPTPGEVLTLSGEWAQHPKYGRQFKIVECRSTVPATVWGIQKYLGSGLIKGIGPVMAKRIVARFGKRTLDVIEQNTEELTAVAGIGAKRIGMIRQAWEAQKEIRDVMLFLQSHGVSTAYAAKIFKRYGQRSIEVVKQNPYRLATDIFGIGFLSADRIAARIGLPPDSPLRIQAGILHVLHQTADEGHVHYPYEPLLERCREILAVERDLLVQAFGPLVADKRIVIEDLEQPETDHRANRQAVYLAKFHLCETGIAADVHALLQAPRSVRPVDTGRAVEWVQQRLAIRLAREQIAAVETALKSKSMVITGGPGTGKTTIIHAILKIYARLGTRVLLAAPTGRAAKRMSEATGAAARTIHRMLEYSLQKGGFQRNADRPLECDLLVVDEASMIDTVLMYHLLKALPAGAVLLLVGDVYQLPSVGAGSVLRELISSGRLPVIELTRIFRQARESQIIVNAHRINRGQLPEFKPSGPLEDFYFIEQEDPEEVLRIMLELVRNRIPRRFGQNPLDDIQVLTPMHRGVVGAVNLNERLQETLNPGREGLVRGSRTFRLGDKVMQIRNNYDKDVFNGDIGRIVEIDMENQELAVSLDGRTVTYDFSELDEIILAYAISVHKSQGSEYSTVILPLLPQHYMLLQRNLLYTAVTRGKKLVVVVGTRKALAIAVRNDKTQRRYTLLAHRLRKEAVTGAPAKPSLTAGVHPNVPKNA